MAHEISNAPRIGMEWKEYEGIIRNIKKSQVTNGTERNTEQHTQTQELRIMKPK